MADWSGSSNNGPRAADHGQLVTQARAAFTARFGGEPDRRGVCPRPGRASGQPYRLQRRSGHGRGDRSVDTSPSAVVLPGREASIDSVNFGQADAFSLDEIERTEAGAWTRYVRGVCWALTIGAGRSLRDSRRRSPATCRSAPALRSSASLQASVACFLIQLGLLPGRSQPRLQRQSRRPPSHGTGQGTAAVRK